MDTANGVPQRFGHIMATRPSAPGLVVVGGLLLAAVSGQALNIPGQLWLTAAVAATLAVAANAGRHEVRREIHLRRHQRRMHTVHGLLTERAADRAEAAADVSPLIYGVEEATGTLRELEAMVEDVNLKLDGLLREVQSETAGATGKQRRA